jgi:hypothetical protein
MSSDQLMKEQGKTQEEECIALLYKKWEIELADYLAELQMAQEEKYIHALGVSAWWEELDLDCSSSDSCTFEEGDEGDDLEEKIRQYKLDLRCNMQ